MSVNWLFPSLSPRITLGFPIPMATRFVFKTRQGFSLAFPVEQRPQEETGGHKPGYAVFWSTPPLARPDLQSQTYPSRAVSAAVNWGC